MISLEGLIGAGKSEVLKELACRGHTVKLEPTDSWTLLKQFYSEKTNAFALQVQIMASYAHDDYRSAEIIERSPDTALGIFAEMLKPYMHTGQYEALGELALLLKLPRPEKFIYLEVPVHECMRRIRCRGRNGEANITEEYLNELAKAHTEFFKNYDVHRVRLQGTESVSEVAELVERLL
jgi:deoxyadenosine/deoxycytidine kinase